MGKSAEECIANIEREFASLKTYIGGGESEADDEPEMAEKEFGRGRRRGRRPFFKKKDESMDSEEGEY